jgi:hypothetical protein
VTDVHAIMCALGWAPVGLVIPAVPSVQLARRLCSMAPGVGGVQWTAWYAAVCMRVEARPGDAATMLEPKDRLWRSASAACEEIGEGRILLGVRFCG